MCNVANVPNGQQEDNSDIPERRLDREKALVASEPIENSIQESFGQQVPTAKGSQSTISRVMVENAMENDRDFEPLDIFAEPNVDQEACPESPPAILHHRENVSSNM